MKKTGLAAVKMITRIRSRNNRLWMALLALAVESSPRKSKAIIAKIAQNDTEITRWLHRV